MDSVPFPRDSKSMLRVLELSLITTSVQNITRLRSSQNLLQLTFSYSNVKIWNARCTRKPHGFMFQGLNIIKYLSNIPSCSILMFRIMVQQFLLSHTTHILSICDNCGVIICKCIICNSFLFVVYFCIAYDTLNVGHSGVSGKMLVEQAEQDGQNENTYLLICRNIYHVLHLSI